MKKGGELCILVSLLARVVLQQIFGYFGRLFVSLLALLVKILRIFRLRLNAMGCGSEKNKILFAHLAPSVGNIKIQKKDFLILLFHSAFVSLQKIRKHTTHYESAIYHYLSSYGWFWFRRWLQDDDTWWNAMYTPKDL